MVVEFVIRLYGDLLSLDIQHVKSIPAISANLPAKNGVRILFIGNSLTRRGINRNTFEQELSIRVKLPLNSTLVYPDDTSIIEWFYVFKSYFIARKLIPDILIINFAYKQLHDTPIEFEEIQRLSSYTSVHDVSDIIVNEGLGFGESIEFVLSKFSKAFSNRQRVQIRILDLLPYYRHAAGKINSTLSRNATHNNNYNEGSFLHLRQFIDLARLNNIRIVFVAFPVQGEYAIEPMLIKIIQESGMILVDGRTVSGLAKEHYLDSHHLNQEGAEIYSDFLASYLASIYELWKNYE